MRSWPLSGSGGMDEDEIARVTGFTAPMIRAVLRTL
jgi:hypothetical protein